MKFETEFYYTLLDSKELIDKLGFFSFIESLMTEKKARQLTSAEKAIISQLHDQWEL
tara:strand:- start:2094 stop:2264 length:171 start_codon:yes stop_codon:yes gene_type:complete